MSNKVIRKMSPMAQQAVQHYVASSESLNPTKARSRAQALLLAQGFPTQRDEAWQYTKLTQFVQKRFEAVSSLSDKTVELIQKKSSPPPCSIDGSAIKLTIKLIFVDGIWNQSLSDDLSNLPKGLSIQSTARVADVSNFNEALVHAEPFGVLNSALYQDGFQIEVAQNTALETPVFVLHVQTQPNGMSALRNRVVLAENSELTLIEQFVSLNDDSVFEACTNVVTETEIAQSARLRQVIVQQQSDASYYFYNQFVFQADNSDFNTFYGGMGSALSRHQNHLFMNGEHIENSQNSACLARQKQVVDSRTYTEHKQEWGASRQLHKYVLADSAVGVFNGMICVDRVAQKTDGQMDNKNLLLSNHAKMNCKPQLEIYADDVKCSHGSATGQINQDQVFYLQARGIPRIQAVEMITKAFLMQPVESIANPHVRTWVGQLLAEALLSGGYFASQVESEEGGA